MNKSVIRQVKKLFLNTNLNPNTIKLILDKNIVIKNKLITYLNNNKQKYHSLGKLVKSIVTDLKFNHCLICNKELSYDQTINNAKYCSNICRLKNNPYSINEVKEKIKEKRKTKVSIFSNIEIKNKMIYSKKVNTYNKIINKYKDSIQPLFDINNYFGSGYKYKWKCIKCGNVFEAIYNNGKIFGRCYKCFPKTYNKHYGIYNIINFLEKDCHLVLDKIDVKNNLCIKNNNIIIFNKLIPNNICLDINKFNKDINYRLIHIFEYNWVNPIKQQILKDKLKAILNIEQERIYARKCIIKEIDSKIKNEFLNKYHIQGEDKSKIKLGLFYNNNLVAVMTFNKPRFNKKYEYELIRYATKAGYRVLGGAGKLLKYFERNYKPKSLITYADRSYSQGNMYRLLGFTELTPSGPNYVYVKDNIVLTRYQCQKHKLKKILGESFNNTLTETENMILNGFIKVYDCGNLVFEKNIN